MYQNENVLRTGKRQLLEVSARIMDKKVQTARKSKTLSFWGTRYEEQLPNGI